MITGREIRFAALLVIGFVLLFFVTCGRGSSSAKAPVQIGPAPTANSGRSEPTAPPTPPPTTPLPIPTPGGLVAKAGSGDKTYPISPSTYESLSDPCAFLPSDVASLSAPKACRQAWSSINPSDIPGADLMNTMGMPHTVDAGRGVSEGEAVAAATGFYRWQAFQTWAENSTVVAAMQALDPPSHTDPVIDALAGQTGARVTAVPACNLPVALRVVRLDPEAIDYIRSQGWNVAGKLAVVATYPSCPGVTVTLADNTSNVVAPSPAVTAINPGELGTIEPFGRVWKIDGEAACGTSDKLSRVCEGAN